MGKLNTEGMRNVEKQMTERARGLRDLLSTPFDHDNHDQQALLKKYVDDFELNVNQMYLFQGMSTGLNYWGGSFIVGRILPIPEFVNYILAGLLYAGVAGYILEHFSMKDFYSKLEEMKSIYTWCVKSNAQEIDANLGCREVQRLTKNIAPLCSNDFMVSWPKTAEERPDSPGLVSAGYAALSSAFSIFYRGNAPKIDANRVRDLKMSVETRGLDVGVYSGVEQALRYFATSIEFRGLLASKLERPLGVLQHILPASVMENFTPKRA